MKKGNILLALMLLMAIVIMPSCSSGNGDSEKVMSQLKTYNSKLPITFDNDDMLDSVYYDGGGHKAVFNYIVNTSETSVEELATNSKAARELVVSNICSSAEAMAMFKEMAENEVEVRTVLLNPRSHSSVPIDFGIEEIKAFHAQQATAQAKPQAEMTARDSLDVMVDSINSQCPDSIDSRTELTNVRIENNYLVYNYVLDESKAATIDKLAGDVKRKKQIYDSKYRKAEAQLQQLLLLCIDNGLGIKHRYVGRSTKQAEGFAFSAVELSKITNHPLPEGYEANKDRVKPLKLKKATGKNAQEVGIF